MKTTPCRGCGKQIIFARTPEGTLIPCDPRPQFYYVYQNPTEEVRCRRMSREISIEESNTAIVAVSHFATCSHANEFGKGKR